MSVLDWSSSPAVNGWLDMQAATWRCNANDVAVATAAAAVRRSDVGELHVRSIRPTGARQVATTLKTERPCASAALLGTPKNGRAAV